VEAYGRGVCEERAAAIVRQAALGLLYMKRSHRIAHRYVRVGVGGCLCGRGRGGECVCVCVCVLIDGLGW